MQHNLKKCVHACVLVCMYTFVGMCGSLRLICGTFFSHFDTFFSFFLITGSFLNLILSNLLDSLATEAPGSPCLCHLHPCHPELGLKIPRPRISFHLGAGNLNSGPRICPVSTLPMSQCLNPLKALIHRNSLSWKIAHTIFLEGKLSNKTYVV